MNHTPQIKKTVGNLFSFYRIIFLTLIFYILITSFFAANTQYLPNPLGVDSYIVEVLQVFTLLLLSAISYYWPGKIIENARNTFEFAKKLAMYRFALYLRYSLMNLAGLLVAIGFMFSGNINLIYLQAMIVLFFVVYKPSTARLVIDLDINYPEEDTNEE